MINITLTREKDGGLHSCVVSGHARYAEKGDDVVCAAVSILVRVAVLQLQKWALDDKGLKVSLDYQKTGFVDFCVLQSSKDSREALAHLFDFLKLGFESICFEYASHVKLEVC